MSNFVAKMHQIRHFCLHCVICQYGLSKNMTRANAARTSWIHGQLGLMHNSYECEQLPLDCIGFVSMNSYTSTRTRTHVNVNSPLDCWVGGNGDELSLCCTCLLGLSEIDEMDSKLQKICCKQEYDHVHDRKCVR